MQENPSYRFKFIHPRYWPTWFAIFVLWLLAKLPYRLQFKLGKIIGLLAMSLFASRKRIARINISRCFPDLSTADTEALLRKSFIALGQGILISALAWWGKTKTIEKLIVNIEGKEHLQQAFAQQRGVILLGCHSTADEIGGRIISLLCSQPLNIMHRPQNNTLFEYILQKKRHHYIKKVILATNVRQMLRALKNNEGVFYLPDQNFKSEHSIFVPFLGVNTLTLTATARFARMNNCAVLPCFCSQRADGKGFDVIFQPILKDYPSGNDRDDAIRVNQTFEKMIKAYPEQYFWVHRRFKVRPPGEAPFY